MLNDLPSMVISIPPLLMALTIHECAHAWTASKLGDPTARMLGRVTLNPIKHLDLIGSLALLITGMFGWAKPVPVVPRNFRNPSKDMMIVAAAGPVSNLLLAVFLALAIKAAIMVYPEAFNLGYAAAGTASGALITMAFAGLVMNIGLAVFNFLPIPPLDGSKVVEHFLPYEAARAYSKIEPYGFIILIVLIYAGITRAVVWPVVSVLQSLLIKGIFA